MVMRTTSAAVIHQKLQPRSGGSAALRASTGTGAHSEPHAHRWSAESASPQQLELHAAIQSLKTELAALQQQKHLHKTAVLKRQKALSELGRIAASIAKQPNLPAGGEFGAHAHSPGPSPSSGGKRAAGRKGEEGGELAEKVSHLRTSNEIARLELERLQEQLSSVRAAALARTSGAREQAQLDRERSELVQAVSASAAARELDDFKRAQCVADLRFAVDEMSRTLAAKKKETNSVKMQTLQLENQNANLQQEYQQLQAQLDAWAARQVG
jgi:regulator of replication initiation timing